MTHPTIPWWRTEEYTRRIPLPRQMMGDLGPEGIALVRQWKSGKTDPGWGEEDFMQKYQEKVFSANPVLEGYKHLKWSFAIVMRSVNLVCVDIDGKNGGFQHAGKLGRLPRTLAETSKSGHGYHLYYRTSDDVWSDTLGFGKYPDRIGIEQGVDIRSTGCVFHFPQQKWNSRVIAELPDHLKVRIPERAQAAAAQTSRIQETLNSDDPMEVLLMQDQLLEDLRKPIPPGRRNSTLFAIGAQLFLAQVPGWEPELRLRAAAVLLDTDETDKLVANIKRYGHKHLTP